MSVNIVYLIFLWTLSLGACAWFYYFKKRMDNDFDQSDCMFDEFYNDSLETTEIVGEFKVYLEEIKIRVSANEISTKRARELVLRKQAKAYRRIQTGKIKNALISRKSR